MLPRHEDFTRRSDISECVCVWQSTLARKCGDAPNVLVSDVLPVRVAAWSMIVTNRSPPNLNDFSSAGAAE
jgi:hypothetical protein